MPNCPQCNSEISEPTQRLVQDSCGHQKCRICLLGDSEKCKQCFSKPQTNLSNTNSNKGVIKYESSQPNGSKSKPNDFEKRSYQPIIVPNHVSFNNGVYSCKICKKEFKTKGHVKFHQYCVGGKMPLKCKTCLKEFVSKSHLHVHLLSHEEKKPHVCAECNKTFVTKSKLKRHSLMHSGDKSFVCTTCGKSFFSKDKLKVHHLTHSKEKPFGCKQCKARFNNSSNLKKHLSVHLKEGVHMCDQCGKRFKLKATLMIHRKVHSNYRSYQCESCPKAFFNRKDLQRHALVHSEEKLYNCEECKIPFRRKDNLHRHIRNSHPGKKLPSEKTSINKSKPQSKIIDTPNAINVITSSKSTSSSKDCIKTPPVINGPFKLAFKTSAFKNTYNIQRNIEPEDNVNIYEKILLPNNIISKRNDVEEEIGKKSVERDDQEDVYKVFKFKLMMNKEKYLHENQSDEFNSNIIESAGKTYTELRTVSENCASVIVSANNKNDAFKNHIL
ncbi:zinc finger protein 260-like [Onthophagus taurus]|uniref:zinc finger protein 260-like n=1 Tax=Onthophagus taurus TaxID=166361 RepID=UPI000C20BD6E|nr:gastrula zinc finger protein XlCGF57.1-like [Onthophagus taurus]